MKNGDWFTTFSNIILVICIIWAIWTFGPVLYYSIKVWYKRIFLVLFAGLTLISCGPDEDIIYEEPETVTAKTYIPWQGKEYIYNVDQLGAVLDDKYPIGAKTSELLQNAYGGQVKRNSDLPTLSDKWYLNKKGRNPYALIKVATNTDVWINNNFPLFIGENFRYVFVRKSKMPEPVIHGNTYNHSFKEAVQIRKRRIYHYQ